MLEADNTCSELTKVKETKFSRHDVREAVTGVLEDGSPSYVQKVLITEILNPKETWEMGEALEEVNAFSQKLRDFLQSEDVQRFFKLLESIPGIAEGNKLEDNRGHTRNILLGDIFLKIDCVLGSLEKSINTLKQNYRNIERKGYDKWFYEQTLLDIEKLKTITKKYAKDVIKPFLYAPPAPRSRGREPYPRRNIFPKGPRAERGV